MPAFKDEHIIIIAPGSQTTRAQLGLPETFTPPPLTLKSRMFPASGTGEWEPNKVRKKRKTSILNPDQGTNGNANGEPTREQTNGTERKEKEDIDQDDYEEDLLSDEGAVWPIREGRVVDWSCFCALLQHVHNLLNAPLHTPILLIAQPAWTPHDHHRITKFFFEKFRPPAFALMDAASACSYAYGVPTACVVDVGLQKTDVTAVTEHLAQDEGRSIAVANSGGEQFTQTLHGLLGPKGLTKDMCEQLKKSTICEILPSGVPIPGSSSTANGDVTNPASAASTGAEGSGANQRHTVGSLGQGPRGPGKDAEVQPEDGKDEGEDEGVLDVAGIVTGGKMGEFLEQKEKEKQERLAAKRKGDAAAAQSRPVRLKNQEREKNTFYFEDHALLDALKNSDMDSTKLAETKAALDEGPKQTKTEARQQEQQHQQQQAQQQRQEQAQQEHAQAPAQPEKQEIQGEGGESSSKPPEAVNGANPSSEQNTSSTSQPLTSPIDTNVPQSALPQSAPQATISPLKPNKPVTAPRREITVGVERFQVLSEAHLGLLASSIYRTIQSIPIPSQRTSLWDNLIIVGCGARVRGFKEALVSSLNARYIISPSSATMFISELPSNFSTPIATGTNTPLPQSAQQQQGNSQHVGSGVNRLLYAATTASAGQQQQKQQQQHGQTPQQQQGLLQTPGSQQNPQTPTPPTQQRSGPLAHNEKQTPTSIRLAQMPNYFPEFKAADAGTSTAMPTMTASSGATAGMAPQPGSAGLGGSANTATGSSGVNTATSVGAGEAEAVFLGAQVAAKTIFIANSGTGVDKGYVSRNDYNENGPQVVGDFML
ncbi:MAG: Actin-like protein arp9 (SWI/SNF complex component arp9) [Alyxoria varia]|nr:MAG: Actin-like protein arp9 (SWI/SNF complex component arp9) [Alyxoria varia]